MNLRNAFEGHGGFYTIKLDAYLDIYPRHLNRFIGSSATLIEFGVFYGGSLQVWRRWLGPSVRIIGVDCSPKDTAWTIGEGIIVGRQEDQALLATLPAPDIVIDDCSHRPQDQIDTFDALWPRLKPNGVYAIEDLTGSHTVSHVVEVGTREKAFVCHYGEIIILEKNDAKWGQVSAGELPE